MDMHALERAKQQWQYAADSMPQLICLVGGDASVIRANRTLERWGLGDVARVRGRYLHEVMHGHCTNPDCYLDLFLRQATRALASGRRGRCEAWDPVLKRHLAISAQLPVHEPTQAADFFAIFIVDDLSELKAAEARAQLEKQKLGQQVAREVAKRLQVEEIKARLHVLLERTPMLIGMADAGGALLYLNPAGRALIGLGGEDDICELTLSGIHAPGVRERLTRLAIPAAADRGLWSGESSLLARDGREIKVSQQIIAHHGPDGRLEGLSVIERDMSDWVRTGEALRTLREELLRLSAQHVTFQESERQRIAADLHDGLGQSLSLFKLSIEEAARLIREGSAGEAADSLRRLVPKLKNAMDELRRISMDLRPSTLDDLGILPTLSWFFREFEAACPDVEVDKDLRVVEADVPAPLRLSIYRIVQEAVNNVVKHAGAKRISVRLGKIADALQLSIEDDGAGFDPAEAATRGFAKGLGLQNMKERADLSGGTWSIESAPGRGTRIRVSWRSTRTADGAAGGEVPLDRLLRASSPSGAGASGQTSRSGRDRRASLR